MILVLSTLAGQFCAMFILKQIPLCSVEQSQGCLRPSKMSIIVVPQHDNLPVPTNLAKDRVVGALLLMHIETFKPAPATTILSRDAFMFWVILFY